MQISQNKYRLNKGEESTYSVIQSMRNHENLIIWKDSLTLVNEVYRLVKLLPKQESYGLYSQMTRAAISISSNIAEGCSRSSKKEFSRFLEISIGSAFELQTQLIIVRENYRVPEINSLINKTRVIQRQISSYKSKINQI